MPSPFTLIADSWHFCRKQPTLHQVGFWLLFLPMLATAQLSTLEKTVDKTDPTVILLMVSLFLVIALLLLWGQICVLVIGKRLLQTKAGRSRTSFKSVCKETRSLLVPYLLTSILRSAITLLWSILLIIPGIIYSTRTAFYGIVMAVEGLSYRPALRRSQQLVTGQTWGVFWRLLCVSFLLFVPIQLLVSMLDTFFEEIGSNGLLFTDIIDSLLSTITLIVFLVSLIAFYGALLPGSHGKTVTWKKNKKA